MASRLKIDDLQVVKNDLWEARTKWKDFGLALLMRNSALESIDMTQRGKPDDCLREMLADWLRGAGDPPRTWSTIVAALGKVESLGSLAEEVGQKHDIPYEPATRENPAEATPEYQTIVECTSRLNTAVRDQLIDLSAQLLQRNLIMASQESEMRNTMHSPESRAAKLLEFVRNKVKLNPRCYDAFIEALEQDQATNQIILSELKTKYRSLSGVVPTESQNPTTTSPRQVQTEAAATTSTTATGQVLGIGDLDAVLEAIWEARKKWFYIGLNLGTKKEKLENIKQDNEDVDDRFTEMVLTWLSNDEGTYTCTWATLATVLKSPSVRFGQLADKLPK